jgi:hypothetical protein
MNACKKIRLLLLLCFLNCNSLPEEYPENVIPAEDVEDDEEMLVAVATTTQSTTTTTKRAKRKRLRPIRPTISTSTTTQASTTQVPYDLVEEEEELQTERLDWILHAFSFGLKFDL